MPHLYGIMGALLRTVEVDDGLVYRILDAARMVHTSLGPGFIEGIYGRALTVELRNREFRIDREKAIKIWYGASLVGKHRLDILVNDSVIIELKASRSIIPVHIAQMQSYLHASSYEYGLVLNFGTAELQWEIVRISDLQNRRSTGIKAR
jgi:GxxExxY protein